MVKWYFRLLELWGGNGKAKGENMKKKKIILPLLLLILIATVSADVLTWDDPYYRYNFTGTGEGWTKWAFGGSANPDYSNNDFRSSTTDQVAINNTLNFNGTAKIDFTYTWTELSNWVIRVGFHNSSDTCTGAWDSREYWQINPTVSQVLSYRHNCVATATLENTCNYGSSTSGDSFTFEQLSNGTYYISHNGVNVCNATWVSYDAPNTDQLILASRRSSQHLDNVNVSIFQGTPAPAPGNFVIRATNELSSDTINTFNATVGAVEYTTTNGTISTPLNLSDGGIYNITLYATNFVTKLYPDFDTGSEMDATLLPITLLNLTYSDKVLYSGQNYTRNLSYTLYYICQDSGELFRFINGSLNLSQALTCTNETASYSDIYQGDLEGPFTIDFVFNATPSVLNGTGNNTFIQDLNSPNINISANYTTDFVLPTVNITVNCSDTIFPILYYNISFNSGLIYEGNKSSGSQQSNLSTNLINGYNNVTATCSDPFSSTSSTNSQLKLLRTLYIIDEQNNIGFDVSNLTQVKAYLDDNRTSYDFKANGKNNITFVADSEVKLRFELVYSDGTIILRYVDIGLLEDDIRVCANVEGITHYEQLLTSATVRPVVLKSVFADCVVAADYTRFAYQNTKALKAYTYNNLYYLYTFDNDEQVFLASVDGSIASYINLDTLEFLDSGYNLNLVKDALSFQKSTDTQVIIYYKDISGDNVNTRLQIYRMDTGDSVLDLSNFSDPNEFTLYFDTTTLNNTNSSTQYKSVLTTTNAAGDSDTATKFFNLQASTGVLTSSVAFVMSFLLMIFGLSLASTEYTFSWFGIIVTVAAIAILALSVLVWYTTLLMALEIIVMVYIGIGLVSKTPSNIG